MPKLLIFDLDGTLIDSRVDLCNSVNAMLDHFHLAALPEPVIASYIGDGASALVRRALSHTFLSDDPAPVRHPAPLTDAYADAALTWFIGYYRVHKLDYTYVYPGVEQALETIRERYPSLPMAVLTNKPVNPSREICRHFKLDRFFFANYGGNSFATKKPDPTGFLHLISEASDQTRQQLAPSDTVMIGDSHVDVETAKACGARSLGCLFGLSPASLIAAKPDALVKHASEWPEALGL